MKENDPYLEQKVKEQLMNQALGGAIDLGATEECKLCQNTYVKRIPGDNVCGACQVAMAIGIVWRQVLYHRWGVIPVRTYHEQRGSES